MGQHLMFGGSVMEAGNEFGGILSRCGRGTEQNLRFSGAWQNVAPGHSGRVVPFRTPLVDSVCRTEVKFYAGNNCKDVEGSGPI